MPKKRKVDDSHLEISKIHSAAHPTINVDRNEIVKLTKEAKSWDFTCTFCFKRFPSAQAMGGHQNAHKGERLEEKRLFVKDPIGYRKRAYLLAMKKNNKSTNSDASSSTLNLHATFKTDPQNILIQPNYLPAGDHHSGQPNADLSHNYHCHSRTSDPLINEDAAKAMACVERDDIDNHGINFEKLDLTLKL